MDSQHGQLERQLSAVEDRAKIIEQLQWDRDCILTYGWAMPESTLDMMTPQQRHSVYRRLRLRATIDKDGDLQLRIPVDEVWGGINPLQSESTLASAGTRR
jgi:hypothetical protein